MKSSMSKMANNFMREKKNRRRWMILFLCLAAVVAFGTVTGLRMTGQAMTQKEKVLICEQNIHEHTKACYDEEKNLICGQADYVVHTHNDDCYDSKGALTCQIPEKEEHKHTDECYTEEKTLVCGQEENAGHEHTEDCYVQEKGELICGQEEHAHDADCYDEDEELICGAEEHAHTDDCYEMTDVLSCGQEEGDGGHSHTADCYEVQEVLSCGELELHTHDENCFEKTKDGKGNYSKDEAGNYIQDKDGNLLLTCTEIELKEHVHAEETNCFEIVEVASEDNKGPFNLGVIKTGDGEVDTYDNTDNPVAVIAAEDGNNAVEGNNSLDKVANKIVVTVKKRSGDQWIVSDQFKPGDDISIDILYSIPAGNIKKGAEFTYQIPSGLIGFEDGKALTFDVTQGGKKVGTATVTPDGKVVIKLDENSDLDLTKGIEGGIHIEGTVKGDSNSSGGSFEFPGTGTNVQVKNNEPEGGGPTSSSDLNIWKGHTQVTDNSDGTKTIKYTITINSGSGSDGFITLSDSFSDIIPDGYGTFTVKDQNGVDVPYEMISSPNNGKFSMKLPKLEKGGSYTITYTVTVDPKKGNAGSDGSVWVNNNATADDGKHKPGGSDKVQVQNPQISKTGEYKNGKFTWTITVAAGHKGEKLWDIPGNDLNAYLDEQGEEAAKQIPVFIDGVRSQYTLWDLINGKYTIPDNDSHIYTYSIEPDLEAGENVTFTNGAQAGGTEPGKGGSSTGPGSTSSNRKEWDTNKSVQSSKDVMEGTGEERHITQKIITWKSSITFPEGEWTDVVYADTFDNIVKDPANNWAELEINHYADRATFENELRNSLDSAFAKLAEQTGVDFRGHYDIQLTPENGDITGFKIKLHNPNTNKSNALTGKRVEFTYKTIVDTSAFTDGTDYDIYNNFELEGKKSGRAQFHYHHREKGTPKLEKSAKLQKSGSYSSGDLNLVYGTNQDADGNYIIDYQIAYQFEDETSVTITDTIPAGMNLDLNSIHFWFLQSAEGNSIVDNVAGVYPDLRMELREDSGILEEGQYNIIQNEDGSTTITAKFPSTCFTEEIKDAGGIGVVLRYTCTLNPDELTDDQFRNLANGLINTAEANGEKAEHKTTVNNPSIEKSGNQETDDEGNLTNRVSYTLVVNPDARDLIPGSDTITLYDNITLKTKGDQANVSGAKMYLDYSSVKVYYYNPKDPDDRSKPYDGEYSFRMTDTSQTADNASYQLVVDLPDSVALVVEYAYIIDPTTANGGTLIDPKVVNTANLAGQTADSGGVTVHAPSGTGWVDQDYLTIQKVDSKTGKLLADAEFDVYYWNETKKEWLPVEGRSHVVTHEKDDTNKDGTSIPEGVIEFNKNANADYDWQTKLEDGVLYALVETQSPEGYRKLVTPFYFCRLPAGTTANAMWKQIQESGVINQDTGRSEMKQRDINFFTTKAGTFTVGNKPQEPDTVELHKVDQYQKAVPGAHFDVYYFDYDTNTKTGTWKLCKADVVTDENGDILFTTAVVADDEKSAVHLEYNTIYAMWETQAPEGYNLPDANSRLRAFALMDPESKDDNVKNGNIIKDQGNNGAYHQDIVPTEPGNQTLGSESGIKFFYASGGSLSVENKLKKTEVKVEKKWDDGDSEKRPESINVTLKRRMVEHQTAGLLKTEPTNTRDWCELTLTLPSQFEVVGDGWTNGNTYHAWVPKNSKIQLSFKATSYYGDYHANAKFGQSTVDGEKELDLTVNSMSQTVDCIFDVGNNSTYVLKPTATGEGNGAWSFGKVSIELGKMNNIITEDPDYSETVTLREPKWSYTWSDLEAKRADGKIYEYYIEESVPGGYEVSYENNNGILYGTITITNTADQDFGYELPETGGNGTALYLFGGAAVIAAGMMYSFNLRRRKVRR